jgi:putative tricarboxylic transport membrane protein
VNLDIVLGSLGTLLTTPYLMWLMVVAVFVGMVFGVAPGLGGKLGIVMLIPFVYGMEPIAGAVFLLSMHAVVHTGSSVPGILFGVPDGGPGSATVVDGYPMTQNGEAGRALGAMLMASGVGGVIGAVFLALLLPLLQPILLSFSPAEFFLLAILGITFIATLSGDSLVKGLVIGLFGLMLAFVGLDPMTGIERYAFGQLFLWDGIDIVIVVLAMFAIPEMVALGVKGGSISNVAIDKVQVGLRGVWQGCRDVFVHWGLTIRTSIIGAFVGLIPGLGGDAASWLCYGHAVQSSKTPERFGKGAVEGVIAPETANNSKEGGALLPTLFFGIPGSSGMAVMIGALVILGIQPGPTLLTKSPDLVWTLIWALVVANILAVVIFVFLAPSMGSLAFIRAGLMIPFIIVLSIMAAFVAKGHWQNIVLMIALGALGYLLKRFKWPRPPFVIGIILGPIAENALHKSLAIWGYGFFLRPLSLVLIGMCVASIVFYILRREKLRSLAFDN